MFFLLLGHVAAPAQQPASVAADLVLLNGKIVTLEENAPQVEAVAIGGNRIAALGSSAEMKRHIGEKTQVIDVAGALVIPGFVESHGHFNGVGLAQLNLNLMKAKSWDEIVAQVEQAVKKAKPGEWIYGRGWHQEKWNVEAGAGGRRIPDTRVAQPRVAGQPGPADARQRPCHLRQCQSHGAFRGHANDTESAGRGLSTGRQRKSDGPFSRDGLAPDSNAARASHRDRREKKRRGRAGSSSSRRRKRYRRA